MAARGVPAGRAVPLVVCVLLAASRLTAVADEPDCADAKVHCVDDTAGAMREFASIQAAVDVARKGHTVLVAAGDYAGFRVSRKGSKNKRLVVRALPGARVVTPEPVSGSGIYLSRASYVTIDGFEVDGGEGVMYQGIAVRDATAKKPMRDVRIVGNTVYGADRTNIYVSNARDSLIEGNSARDSRASHGIYLANGGADGVTVRGNVASGNAKNGIHCNGDASVGGDGLHQDLLVEGNTLYDNAANGFDLDGVRDSVVRNNLVYGNGRHGLRAFAIDAAGGPSRLVIANNTFVDNRGWAVKLSQDDGGHLIFNNILLSDDGGLAAGNPLLQSDFNVVHGRFSLNSDDTVLTFRQWQAAGYGASSSRAGANKVFSKAAKGDYHLKASSPAVDAGTASLDGTSAPSSDIEGAERPAGRRHDVGAYERGGEVPP